MKPEATPWRVMLSAALSFGVKPAHFWRLSLKEWRALAPRESGDTFTRAALTALAQRFPDRTP